MDYEDRNDLNFYKLSSPGLCAFCVGVSYYLHENYLIIIHLNLSRQVETEWKESTLDKGGQGRHFWGHDIF